MGGCYELFTFDEFSHSVKHFRFIKPGEIDKWDAHFVAGPAFEHTSRTNVNLHGNYRLIVKHSVLTPDEKNIWVFSSDSFDIKIAN